MNTEPAATTKALIRVPYYLFSVPFVEWKELDGVANRVTGKWRMEEGTIAFEVEHGCWERSLCFFKKWATYTRWYEEADVRFIQEFDCRRAGDAA